MNLEKRIRALEAKMFRAPVVLQLPDRSRRELHGRGNFLVRLLQGVCGRAVLTAGQAAQLELIRQSVHAQEPGGGRLIELIRCLLQAQEDGRAASAQNRLEIPGTCN